MAARAASGRPVPPLLLPLPLPLPLAGSKKIEHRPSLNHDNFEPRHPSLKVVNERSANFSAIHFRG